MTTHREAVLLTPGPLTTSLRTKLAMLKDWGSWDSDFIAITARVRHSLLDIVHGHDSHVVVPLQGSGTFSVEAAVATVVPRDGHVLVLDNGAYCKRAAKLTHLMGRRTTVVPFAEDAAISPEVLQTHLHHPCGHDPLRNGGWRSQPSASGGRCVPSPRQRLDR